MHRLLASSLSLSLFLFLYYLYATALSSQAARASETHYRALHQGNLYLAIWYLLDHSDGTVKAKTCNLVGNLCRHSGFFYKTLVTPLTDLSPGLYNHSTGARGGGGGGAKGAAGAAGANEPPTILRRLIVRCGDEDRATRKFVGGDDDNNAYRWKAVANALFRLAQLEAVLYEVMKLESKSKTVVDTKAATAWYGTTVRAEGKVKLLDLEQVRSPRDLP